MVLDLPLQPSIVPDLFIQENSDVSVIASNVIDPDIPPTSNIDLYTVYDWNKHLLTVDYVQQTYRNMAKVVRTDFYDDDVNIWVPYLGGNTFCMQEIEDVVFFTKGTSTTRLYPTEYSLGMKNSNSRCKSRGFKFQYNGTVTTVVSRGTDLEKNGHIEFLDSGVKYRFTIVEVEDPISTLDIKTTGDNVALFKNSVHEHLVSTLATTNFTTTRTDKSKNGEFYNFFKNGLDVIFNNVSPQLRLDKIIAYLNSPSFQDMILTTTQLQALQKAATSNNMILFREGTTYGDDGAPNILSKRPVWHFEVGQAVGLSIVVNSTLTDADSTYTLNTYFIQPLVALVADGNTITITPPVNGTITTTSCSDGDVIAIIQDEAIPVNNLNFWRFTNIENNALSSSSQLRIGSTDTATNASNKCTKVNWRFLDNSLRQPMFQYSNRSVNFCLYAIISMNIATPNVSNVPYITVYTHSQGAGDKGWYRSRHSLGIATSYLPVSNEKILIYIGATPADIGFRNITFPTKQVLLTENRSSLYSSGTAISETEIVRSVVLQTSTNTMTDFTCYEMGFRFGDRMRRIITSFPAS